MDDSKKELFDKLGKLSELEGQAFLEKAKKFHEDSKQPKKMSGGLKMFWVCFGSLMALIWVLGLLHKFGYI